jgi:hypothetical protein
MTRAYLNLADSSGSRAMRRAAAALPPFGLSHSSVSQAKPAAAIAIPHSLGVGSASDHPSPDTGARKSGTLRKLAITATYAITGVYAVWLTVTLP